MVVRETLSSAVQRILKAHPDLDGRAIARRVGCHESTVSRVRRGELGRHGVDGRWAIAAERLGLSLEKYVARRRRGDRWDPRRRAWVPS